MKTYYVDGKGYIQIEPEEEKRFLSTYTNAKERERNQVIRYNVPDKGNISITPEEESTFLSTYKNAVPVQAQPTDTIDMKSVYQSLGQDVPTS